jgi:hypothetical protein
MYSVDLIKVDVFAAATQFYSQTGNVILRPASLPLGVSDLVSC